MIFYGWGRDLEKVAYAGINKCRACKNYAHFWIGQSARYVELYFVKVAKYNKKFYFYCDSCHQGVEIEPSRKDEILRATVAFPSHADTEEMWNHFASLWNEVVKHPVPEERAQMFSLALRQTAERLKERFQPEHVDYVLARYVECVTDSDPPTGPS